MADDQTRRGEPPDPARARHLDLDTMSLLVDGALPPAEAAAAEAHLAACPACREDFDELRTTVGLLRGLPQYAPRRSFTLGLEQARAAAPAPRRLAWPGGEGAMRWAALAVAALLLLTTVGQQAFDRSGRLAAPVATAPVAAPAPPEAAQPAFEAQEREEPAAQAPRAAAPAVPPAADAVPTGGSAGTEPAPGASERVDEARPAEGNPPAGVSGWRIAQLGLALALLWLVVGIAGLRWMRRLR